jgi:16S rRNA (guanine1207-N2)-methyltransferase
MSGDKESTPEAKDGLTGDPEQDPAAKLLMDAPIVPIAPKARLLLIEGGCGKLATHFAPRFPQVINHNILYRNHIVSQACLMENHRTNVECMLGDLPQADTTPGLASNSCDEIIFRLGRGTALVNAALVESFRILRPGGSLWVAGHSQEGIKSFAKRAEAHFGNMHLLKIKSSCRLLRFQKASTLPVEPVDDPNYFNFIELQIQVPRLGTLTYRSKPGIFSYRATDIGTALLVNHLPDFKDLSVLDLGCGSGVLSLIAGSLGAKSILAIDANVVATECTAKNLSLHGLLGKVQCTNLTEGIDSEFDIVLSNPPFHHGSETDYSFPGKILDAIHPRLKPGGVAYLVANRFLDYMAQGSSRFQKVEILAREQGYCVYRMRK